MIRLLMSFLIVLVTGAENTAYSQDKTITVFAAASLKNALDDVDATFTKQTGVKVVASYDASSALMKQIESGAPADAFVSADLKWMDSSGPNTKIGANAFPKHTFDIRGVRIGGADLATVLNRKCGG
jgi:ABC-type molybdate transport system substrate-binding protein